MKVLMISGDKRFKPGNSRYDLQHAHVDELKVYVWPHEGLLAPLFARGSYDVVTAQDPLLRGALAWCVAKKIGARLNIQVHMDLRSLSWWKHILAQVVLRHADTVRAVTHKIKNQIKTKARVSVLPVFVDISRFTNLVRRPARNTILWVGRFEDEKDPLTALWVLKKVRAAGVDAKLVMLGTGSLEQKLREHAEGLPVEFAGWDDPANYFPKASVVLCTSKHESYGASIIEALAAGVPVVSPDVGVAREAGALTVSRDRMPGVVAEALRSGARAELKLALLTEKEWVKAWRESL